MFINENEPVPSTVLEAIRNANNITVLSGAGISAESGVPTFRGDEGLWRNFRPEELASPQAWALNPKLVWEWYNWRRELVSKCQPNDAHKALAKLETLWNSLEGKNFTVVTQNVDGLHKQAGSGSIIELHGNLFMKRCTRNAGHVLNYPIESTCASPICEKCRSFARPHIVWFGESLDNKAFQLAVLMSLRADVMFVIGTSGVVQPAAGLVSAARSETTLIININTDSSVYEGDERDVMLVGSAGKRMTEIMTGLGF